MYRKTLLVTVISKNFTKVQLCKGKSNDKVSLPFAQLRFALEVMHIDLRGMKH